MAKPLHHGPVLPLALAAMFALMIPVFWAANTTKEIRSSNAMRLTLPTNEPYYNADENPTRPTPTPKAVKTPRPVSY